MKNKLKVYPIIIGGNGPISNGFDEMAKRVMSNYVEGYHQHLYLISDEEKKDETQCICVDKVRSNSQSENKNSQVSPFVNWLRTNVCESCKKIEATTDPSLELPLIPQSFVDEWIEKKGKIEYVYVQTRTGEELCITMDEFFTGLILTDQLEVIIVPIKNSFNREEVIDINNAYYNYLNDAIMNCTHIPRPNGHLAMNFDEWFDENYN